jgi:hypothetical protein
MQLIMFRLLHISFFRLHRCICECLHLLVHLGLSRIASSCALFFVMYCVHCCICWRIVWYCVLMLGKANWHLGARMGSGVVAFGTLFLALPRFVTLRKCNVFQLFMLGCVSVDCAVFETGKTGGTSCHHHFFVRLSAKVKRLFGERQCMRFVAVKDPTLEHSHSMVNRTITSLQRRDHNHVVFKFVLPVEHWGQGSSR